VLLLLAVVAYVVVEMTRPPARLPVPPVAPAARAAAP
jgi:hypothetical protein